MYKKYKKNDTWNVKLLVDDSFVPSFKQPSVIFCRLTDFSRIAFVVFKEPIPIDKWINQKRERALKLLLFFNLGKYHVPVIIYFLTHIHTLFLDINSSINFGIDYLFSFRSTIIYRVSHCKVNKVIWFC